MKNFLIFLSVGILAILAAYDTKTIIDEIAAITPAQVELKEDIKNSAGDGIEKRFDITPPEASQKPMQNNPNFYTPQNTSKEISPKLNPIEKKDDYQ